MIYDEPPPFVDARWQEDFQGVVKASVQNVSESFQKVEVEPMQVVAPVRVWMEGNDLPEVNHNWAAGELLLEEKPDKIRLTCVSLSTVWRFQQARLMCAPWYFWR